MQNGLGAAGTLKKLPNATVTRRHAPASKASVPEVSAATARHDRSLAEREAAGQAMRDQLPRSRHATWKKPEHRADPIELLRAQDADRLPDLVPIRWGRMLESPFAFYRGSAGLMAADLATT